MPLGALVSPLGPLETLTEHEHKELAEFLAVSRNEDHQALADNIEWLMHVAKKEGPLSENAIVSQTVYHWCTNDESTREGLLCDQWPKSELNTLSKREFDVLKWTLTTLRTSSWFAEWLALQVAAIADATMPADRCPSPEKIMGTLTGRLDEFHSDIEFARRTVESRPDLFQAIAPVAAPAPPTAPDAAPRQQHTGAGGPQAQAAQGSLRENSNAHTQA